MNIYVAASLQKMQIFRIMLQFCVRIARLHPYRSRMFAMIRMPLATASLLAIAISLAGCGEGKDLSLIHI